MISRFIVEIPIGNSVSILESKSGSKNLIGVRKGEECYLFLWRDSEGKSGVLRQLGKFAADDQLNFSWYEAAVLSARLKAEQA